MKEYDEILHMLRQRLALDTGRDDGIVEIVLTPQAFDAVTIAALLGRVPIEHTHIRFMDEMTFIGIKIRKQNLQIID